VLDTSVSTCYVGFVTFIFFSPFFLTSLDFLGLNQEPSAFMICVYGVLINSDF
jgi:hypothetical protein